MRWTVRLELVREDGIATTLRARHHYSTDGRPATRRRRPQKARRVTFNGKEVGSPKIHMAV